MGQFTTLMPLTYRDPITTSQDAISSRNPGIMAGSWEKSASISNTQSTSCGPRT